MLKTFHSRRLHSVLRRPPRPPRRLSTKARPSPSFKAPKPGGSSDMMTRAMLSHLKKHIPGEPTMVSEYMPGGGGMKAANHVFKNVRPDGLDHRPHRRRSGRQCRARRKRRAVRSQQVYLSRLAAQHLPLGLHHAQRSGAEKYRSVTLGDRNQNRRADRRPLELFRRPPVRLSDRLQRSQDGRRLSPAPSSISR